MLQLLSEKYLLLCGSHYFVTPTQILLQIQKQLERSVRTSASTIDELEKLWSKVGQLTKLTTCDMFVGF